jgi:segregation and condensation protein B
MSLKAKLEAVIYAAEEPVTLVQLTALFSSEALAWKAEQEAASAAQSHELADGTTAVETLPLLPERFVYLGLDDDTPVTLPPEPGGAEPVPNATAPPDPETSGDTSPETVQEPNPASAEADATRLARQRDRDVRAILRQLLDELIAACSSDDHGVEIREIAGGFRVATKPECHDAVRQFVKSLKPALKLSLPALETLAVIAYKQPVTAPEVNEIRGVDSSAVFGSLLARKLIATAGRKQVIGRPILYKTTREFLLRFGLKDVSELPSMEEFEKMAAIELDELEPTTGPEASDGRGPGLDFSLEVDETADENADQFSTAAPETSEPTGTAETAASHEPPNPAEAAPAVPPDNEQAEIENSSHGHEEEHQNEGSKAPIHRT